MLSLIDNNEKGAFITLPRFANFVLPNHFANTAASIITSMMNNTQAITAVWRTAKNYNPHRKDKILRNNRQEWLPLLSFWGALCPNPFG